MLYTYISHSRIPKTYYGVKFNYGDKKEVTGVIRDKRFVLCGARLEPHKIPEKLDVTDAVDDLKSENDDKVVAPTNVVEKPKQTRDRKLKATTAVPSIFGDAELKSEKSSEE